MHPEEQAVLLRPDPTRLREVLDSAVFVAGGVSSDLRARLADVTGRVFGADGDLKDSPVVWVGADVPPHLVDSLAWLHTTNAGVDDILSKNLITAGTLFTRTVGEMDRKIAEYVLGWILAKSQHIIPHTRQSRARTWSTLIPRTVAGDLAVVFGVGRIGSQVSRLLRSCGLKVVGVGRQPRKSPDFDMIHGPDGALDVLPEASWVVSTLPLTDETQDYFDDDIFRALRGACFINTGRGATVVFEALERALTAGSVSEAVLDVLPDEPPSVVDRWWGLPNTTMTSHSAGITHDDDVVMAFAECWTALRRGEIPALAVDLRRGY